MIFLFDDAYQDPLTPTPRSTVATAARPTGTVVRIAPDGALAATANPRAAVQQSAPGASVMSP